MISEKFPNISKLNHTFLNNAWVKEHIAKEIRKHPELNEKIFF